MTVELGVHVQTPELGGASPNSPPGLPVETASDVEDGAGALEGLRFSATLKLEVALGALGASVVSGVEGAPVEAGAEEAALLEATELATGAELATGVELAAGVELATGVAVEEGKGFGSEPVAGTMPCFNIRSA